MGKGLPQLALPLLWWHLAHRRAKAYWPEGTLQEGLWCPKALKRRSRLNAVCGGISLLTAKRNTPPRRVFPFPSPPFSIPHFQPRRRQLLSKAASTPHLASNVAISGWTCIPLGLSSHPKVPAFHKLHLIRVQCRWNLLLKTLFCKITHKTTTKNT